jgi:amino acid transporter
MFPINMVAPICALHCNVKEVRLPFFSIWVPGAVYTLCIYWSSNQRFYAISSASTVMTVASLIILVVSALHFIKNEPSKCKSSILAITATLLLLVQLSGEIYSRYKSVFWESDGMPAQTAIAESGPERGIKMTPERLKKYQAITDDISVVRENGKIKKVLFFSRDTVLYLMAEKDMATYSAWLSGWDQQSLDRLSVYYSIFPDKTPDAIYLEADYREYAGFFLQQGYFEESLPSSAILLINEDALK